MVSCCPSHGAHHMMLTFWTHWKYRYLLISFSLHFHRVDFSSFCVIFMHRQMLVPIPTVRVISSGSLFSCNCTEVNYLNLHFFYSLPLLVTMELQGLSSSCALPILLGLMGSMSFLAALLKEWTWFGWLKALDLNLGPLDPRCWLLVVASSNA